MLSSADLQSVTGTEHILLSRPPSRSVLGKTVFHCTSSEMNPPRSACTLVWEIVNQHRASVLPCLGRSSRCRTQPGSPCSSRQWLNCSALQKRQFRASDSNGFSFSIFSFISPFILALLFHYLLWPIHPVFALDLLLTFHASSRWEPSPR